MKIVLKYIFNNIKDRKLRTAVMLLSIILSTTLLFVSLSIGDSYAEAQRKMSRGMAGSATLSVSMLADTDGNPNWITPDAIPDSPSIDSKVGIIQTLALYKENGYYENFDVIAADLTALAQINKPRLLDGGELKDFTGNKIVLPDRFTVKFGIEQGDSFTLWIDGKQYSFEVAAIAAYDTVFLRHTRGTNALIPLETLSEILGAEGGYSKLFLKPAESVLTAELQSELKSSLSEQYSVRLVVNEAQTEADARQKSLPFFLISFFALTMSVFIIYSSYQVITLERLPVIGTFRSIGATERTVTGILMLESFVYGGLGGIIGIPLGFGVLKVMLNGLGNSLSQGIDIPMIVSPLNIAIACLVAIVVSVLSAWLPVKNTSRLPVKEVVLGTVEEKTVSSAKLSLIGAVLLALSIILPHTVGTMGDKALILAGGFSLVGLLVATVIVIPMLTSGASYLLERVFGLFGNEGKLAARNMRGNKNVSQNITLLFISISAIIAISVVGNFVQVYIGDVFRGAALDGFAQATMSSEFVEEAKQLDGIDEVLPIRSLNSLVSGDGQIFSRMEAADDLASYRVMFAMTYSDEKNGSNIEQAFGSSRNILLSADTLKQRGLKVGESITLSANGTEFEYTILGSYKIRATNTEAIIPSFCATDDFGAKNFGILAYTAADPDAVMIQLRDLFGSHDNWSRTVDEFNSDAMGTVSAFLAPMQNLTWFILALATVGIINNLLINTIQKRRATAMYQSVGMSRRQHIQMTVIEALSSGLIGGVIGMVVSWLEIKTIFLVAGPRISMQPELDAKTFLLAGALGIVITLIGSIVPIFKSRQMKLVEEIKFE